MSGCSETLADRTWKSLADIAAEGAPILYGILQPGPDTPGGVPYVRPTEIVEDVIDLSSVRRTTPTIAGKYKRSVLKPDDIILSIVGTIGKVAVVPPELDGGNITQSSVRVRPRLELVLPRYVAWVLRSPVLRMQFDKHRLGTAVPRLNVAHVRALRVPVPPLDEQRQIVAEIEKQFTRLEAGVAALRRVQANLKRYRAAVLKAACEGRLVPTEAELAKAENRKFETGEALLVRILTERQRNRQGRGKYKTPAVPSSTANLPPLPEGWTWATPDQLSAVDDGAICAGPFGTIFKARDFRPEGIPIIFLRHVFPRRYLTRKPGFMDVGKWEKLFRPYSVFGGELLVTKLGEPPGVCAIYPEGIGPAMVTPDVMKMTPNPAAALPMFLMHYFNSETARDFATGVAFGTTRSRLTLPIFREIPVPLPPLAEQTRIVAEVERRLSVVDELESVVTANLQRAIRLRQSILARAFSG